MYYSHCVMYTVRVLNLYHIQGGGFFSSPAAPLVTALKYNFTD